MQLQAGGASETPSESAWVRKVLSSTRVSRLQNRETMARSRTDERLRYHLNANQGDRERLVADLLPQLGPYGDCRPQRPGGGPDRGVDIVAKLRDGGGTVLVAIGFKNDAGPASSDRAWVCSKFRSDLAKAHESGVKAEGFVFVTNVDLTPGTTVSLVAEATALGFHHAELHDRERLRVALDRPEGFFLRLRYLDIAMSAEEQYRLLATVGNELSHLTAQVRSIDSRIQKADMHRGLEGRIRRIGWVFQFDRWDELGSGEHALLFVVPGLAEASPSFALSQEITKASPEESVTTETSCWMPGMKVEVSLGVTSVTGVGRFRSSPQFQVSMLADWPTRSPPTIHEFLRYFVRVFSTEEIANHITAATILVNELTVVDSSVPSPRVFPATAQPLWAEDTPGRFASRGWTALALGLTDEILLAVSPLPPRPRRPAPAP